MTCASQAGPLVATLPYGLAAVAAVAAGRLDRRRDRHGEAGPAEASMEEAAP